VNSFKLVKKVQISQDKVEAFYNDFMNAFVNNEGYKECCKRISKEDYDYIKNNKA
jgi:hypothetical protein